MTKQRAVLIVILCLIFAVGILLLLVRVSSSGRTTSSSPTANSTGWSQWNENGYSFRIPPNWTISTTTYGATSLESTGDNIKLTILPFGPVFDCQNQNICSLDDLARKLGYVNLATTTVGGLPALRSIIDNAAHIIVRVGVQAFGLIITPSSAATTSVVSSIVAGFDFH